MVEKVTCSSEEEKNRLEQEGYIVVSVATFPSGNGVNYTLDRGSDWSNQLKKK